MQDLREFWSSQTFVVDTNGDGVPDDTRLAIAGVSDFCTPVGLIDFTARLGLETSGLSFLLFNQSEQTAFWTLKVELAEIDYAECRLYETEQTVTVVGKNEKALNDCLRWFSAAWPQTLPLDCPVEAVVTIEFVPEHYRVTDQNGKTSDWYQVKLASPRECEPSQHTFKSLTDLWTTSGFYQSGRVDLNSQCHVGFQFRTQPTPSLLEKACQLSARIGLHSTGMQFPLTESPNHPELNFIIRTLEDKTNATMTYQKDELTQTVDLLIEGNVKAVTQGLSYLASAKPYEEGGSFGLWEVMEQDVKEEPLLLETSWEDIGEKERLLKTIDDWAKDMK
ncbi:MAG TPA: hypothetical protein VLK78_10010, partial [Candidatus Angelobacter sp.]|nr:hypothetical protein [Candidatus Angelobacter sp.]